MLANTVHFLGSALPLYTPMLVRWCVDYKKVNATSTEATVQTAVHKYTELCALPYTAMR